MLRHFRLQLLDTALARSMPWLLPAERRKIAVYNSRIAAVTHNLLHLVPLSGAITLLALQWKAHWIGTRANFGPALQFMAKALELLMQASIMDMIVCIVRTQAVNNFVPLGALSGAIQSTQLSYLWSPDFWATFRTRTGSCSQKLLLAVVMPLLLLMTALVGPSAAALMIPRPDTPHIDRSDQLAANSSPALLFPIKVSRNITRTGGEPAFVFSSSVLGRTSASDWNSPKLETHLPFEERDKLHGDGFRRSVLCHTAMEVFSNADREYFNCNHFLCRYQEYMSSTATIPTLLSGDILLRSQYTQAQLRKRPNHVRSLLTFQPLVSVACTPVMSGRDLGLGLPFVSINGSQLVVPVLDTLVDEVLNQRDGGKYQEEPGSGTEGSTLWMASPEAGSHALLVTFIEFHPNISFPSPGNSSASWWMSQSSSSAISVRSCAIRPFWIKTTTRLNTSIDGALLQTDLELPLDMKSEHHMEPITLDADMFRNVSALNVNLFIEQTKATYWSYLATVSALALSEISNYTSIVADEISTALDREEKTTFEVTTTISGFGYGIESTSIKLAMAVITAYCIIAFAYMVYNLLTGSASTAWNSAIEVVALALQSQRPDHLDNISVGIDSMKTFREGVGIRVNEEDELELVFAGDKNIATRRLRKIERNKAY